MTPTSSATLDRSPALDRSAAPTQTPAAIAVRGLVKTYASGFQALKGIDLDIRPGEIFALLGPNGAGKTTLISIICGIVTATSGSVEANGLDIARHYRTVRTQIGLVPQELSTDAFETVFNTVSFSRGLFGKPANRAHIEKVLRDLSLWDKRNNKIVTLSGGMKRRVMIAKALSHEPRILFLDEPTAGVDVELRREMWQMIRHLRATGVTIILTTHYIEEAEDMADRIGVISKGEIILVEEKAALMQKLGKTQLSLKLQASAGRDPRPASRPGRWSARRTGRSWSIPTTPRPRAEGAAPGRAPGSRRSCASSMRWGSASRTCRPGRVRWKTSSSAWSTASRGRRE